MRSGDADGMAISVDPHMRPRDADGMANSVDPDQTAQEQSDLGLH